jgi:SAM-dependent methyltransferase
MANAQSLAPFARLAAPVKALARRFPRLNATMWNVQYRLGMWTYLDSFGANGAEALMLVEKYAPNARILDLGCGTSANMPLNPDRYRHYHGVDVSAMAIAKGRALGRPNTSFEVADIFTYDTSERYDAILLREVLYYFAPEKIGALLRRLAGLLEPGGKIFTQMSHDQLAEFAEPVRTCGLRVIEERAKMLKGGGPEGIFIVLAPIALQTPMATS